MRADRLLSLLMLLQTRGRMTAHALAAELEVSERTIYRDIDALAIAGVPVYTERGTGGGCALLENYRTTLTGLTEDEVRALFMLSIPAPLAQLGLRDTLKSALLKLTASLPAYQTDSQMTVRQRLHIDSTWWFQADEPVPHLATLQQAVWQDRRVFLAYRLLFDTPIEREVEPYGLVAKAGVWFLVCHQHERFHVFRVSDLTDVRLCAETFARPADFDLAAFWADWCQHYEHDRPHYPVVVRVAPDLLPYLPLYFGERVRQIMTHPPEAEADGWLRLTLHFESFTEARTRLLGFGRAVAVLEPEPLRLSIIDYARQILDFYTPA